ncbi:MAG: ROK family protein [Alphaproteobacteria bacterium]|nr:ROK family protein [Alphaproteobacteria bacterium]
MSSPGHVYSSFKHGVKELPDVSIDAYNLENRDADGFVGDRASGRAFRAIFDELRSKVAKVGDDPFGDTPTEALKKKTLDKLLLSGDPLAAGIVHGAVEEFGQKLAGVTRHFLRLKTWRGVKRISIGGGFRQSRIGELAIGRAAVILKSEKIKVDLVPLRYHPDQAALIGCTRLVPAWLFEGFDGLLAVDVGGSNIRCGVVVLHRDQGEDFSAAKVEAFELWRYAEQDPKREGIVDRLVAMLKRLLRKAKKKNLRLAPFVGVGCPGLIQESGTIKRGVQNLPGNWSSSRFNLPVVLKEHIPTIDERETTVVMHNDAVVQGLSEVPRMRDVPKWGVLTIGTGLGNAAFTNRKPAGEKIQTSK